MTKNVHELRIPGRATTAGRSTSVTAAFAGAILPRSEPDYTQKISALTILRIDPSDVKCAYCGDQASEWDHFRPTVVDQTPTGWRTEIGNLVPSCGGCNQSKGNKNWKEWMSGNARLSPANRGVPDLEQRIKLLERFEREFQPERIDLQQFQEKLLWKQYWALRDEIINKLRSGDEIAQQLHQIILERAKVVEADADCADIIPLGATVSEGD